MGRVGQALVAGAVLLAACGLTGGGETLTGSFLVEDVLYDHEQIHDWCREEFPGRCRPGVPWFDLDYEILAAYEDEVRWSDCSDGWSEVFDHIKSGSQVVVRNGEGSVIAKGELGPGVLDPAGTALLGCYFSYEVEVPAADFYLIEIGGEESPVFSHADLEERGWEVHLSISSS